jgi:hypothetical protein
MATAAKEPVAPSDAEWAARLDEAAVSIFASPFHRRVLRAGCEPDLRSAAPCLSGRV